MRFEADKIQKKYALLFFIDYALIIVLFTAAGNYMTSKRYSCHLYFSVPYEELKSKKHFHIL